MKTELYLTTEWLKAGRAGKEPREVLKPRITFTLEKGKIVVTGEDDKAKRSGEKILDRDRDFCNYKTGERADAIKTPSLWLEALASVGSTMSYVYVFTM